MDSSGHRGCGADPAAGLILPEPLRRRKLWLLAARDDRGLSAALRSQDISVSRRGHLGDVLAAQVARTTIEGAAARLDRARQRRDADTFSSVVAGEVAEYFATPAAMTGSDGGPALLAYEIATFDPVIRSWQTFLSFPPVTVGPRPRKRRGTLSSRVLTALEQEVHGAGFHSARAVHTVVSIDAPVTTNVLADRLSDAWGHACRPRPHRSNVLLELSDLVAGAGLSERERDVVQLRAEDHTDAEIAGILGRGTRDCECPPGSISEEAGRSPEGSTRGRVSNMAW